LAIAAYLAVGTLLAFAKKTQNFKIWRTVPAGTYGFVLAHLGVAIFTAGAVIMSVWSQDDIRRLKIGEKLEVAGYEYTLAEVTPGARENFQYLGAKIDVTKNGRAVKRLSTEQRFYPVRNMITSEAGFHFTLGPTIFAAISEGNEQDGWVIRANYHPFVTWIWIGALLMLLAIKLGVTGAPESFLTDKAGNIRYKHVGIITPEIWRDTLLPIVETLRAE